MSVECECEASALQRKWEATFAAVHAQLAALVPTMASMTPDDLLSFVRALEEARAAELEAAVMDANVRRTASTESADA